MKKLLVALLVLLMLVGCSTKEEPKTDEPVVEEPEIEEPVGPVGSVAGGWTINAELPEMNDAIFDVARQGLDGASYSPLFVLGTQLVAGTNYQYLCYQKVVVPNASPSFKVVTVYKALGEESNNSNTIGVKLDASITNIADFEIENYLTEQGETSPAGMMGSWVVSEELPNFLSEEENAIFEKAFEGFTGVGYTPIAKLASQVVAGTNYAFLVSGTTMSAQPHTNLYVVNIYNDLEGNATINNICALNLADFNVK